MAMQYFCAHTRVTTNADERMIGAVCVISPENLKSALV
jgi:hypothetical protein